MRRKVQSRDIKWHARMKDLGEYFVVAWIQFQIFILQGMYCLHPKRICWAVCAKLYLSLMDQDQLAETCSWAIPLEKAISNGKGQRDETRRQSTVALTMRGSPSSVFHLLIFHRNFSKEHMNWRDSRCSSFAEGPEINWGNIQSEKPLAHTKAVGQRPEGAQLHNSKRPIRSAARRLHLVLSVSNTLDLPSAPF